MGSIGAVVELAQRAGRAMSLRRTGPAMDYLHEAVDLRHFTHDNLILDFSNGEKVVFTYKFQDFRGSDPVFAEWDVFIEIGCKRFELVADSNLTTGDPDSDGVKRTFTHYKVEGGTMPLPFTGAGANANISEYDFRWLTGGAWGKFDDPEMPRDVAIDICEFL